MKSLFAAFSLTMFAAALVIACNNSGGGGSPGAAGQPSASSTHQALMAAYSGFTGADTVVIARFAGNTSPTYTDPNQQKMAAALKLCTVTSDGQGGGTIGGAGCPISFTETVTSTSVSYTFKVTDLTFQTYTPVQSMEFKMTGNILSTSGPDTITVGISVTTVSQGTFSVAASVNVTAPNSSGEYTTTANITVTGPTDKANLGEVVTAHNDSSGTQIVDSVACTMDGNSTSCASLGTAGSMSFAQRQTRRRSTCSAPASNPKSTPAETKAS